ncbi:MAG: hypothetical protein HDT20_03935 [Oscillibacter sp.]|nr:hypothetical protein [Oscillibacter sp.]
MNRLTWKRSLDGHEDVGLRDGVSISDAICRLADYEESGLEPEEIMALIDPPNPSLTLEDLREMDGEPVLVEFPKCPEASGWMLVDANRHCVYDGLLGDCDFENCGKTWLAYRRKPEI